MELNKEFEDVFREETEQEIAEEPTTPKQPEPVPTTTSNEVAVVESNNELTYAKSGPDRVRCFLFLGLVRLLMLVFF